MNLISLINFYHYPIGEIDVYDYESGEFLYSSRHVSRIGADTFVRSFSIYEGGPFGDTTTLEIWV